MPMRRQVNDYDSYVNQQQQSPMGGGAKYVI
jgi:uncharacterized short protein YbdD (DUF466 family)